jgi:type I restriction-modification system DNA methylase subunit
MNLFIGKVIDRNLDIKTIPAVHLEILQSWLEMITSKNLAKHKETAVSISFVSKFLEIVLGYKTVSGKKNYTVAQEYPIASGAVDTALGEFFDDKQGDKIHAVFELKGAKTKNLDATIINNRGETPVEQGWRYARDAKGCQWILVTNYLEIRLYAFGETSLVYEAFDLAKLTDPTEYAKFILCLHADNLLTGNTKKLLEESKQAEKDITIQLYEDYKQLRVELINGLTADNPMIVPIDIVPISQKLLDRILFISFAEDNGLLPVQSIKKAIEHIDPYESKPIYQNVKGLFNAVNKGRTELTIPAYNGGLFAPDKPLDKLTVNDELCKGFLKIADYDFYGDISVAVLGHIFEQSISDLEEITAQIQNGESLRQIAKQTSVSGKRKRHGIVYTPNHITAFIVQHTLEEYINQRFDNVLAKFGTRNDDGEILWSEKEKPAKGKEHENELAFWREWQDTLRTIKIVDPACGSGAFLVAAFDVLQLEYQKVNERIAELTAHFSVFDLNKEILNSNLFGVDLNSESIEITKLSLWLKTAQRGKKLENIDNCLQVGNSLGFESPVQKDGFYWQNNFSKILKSGGFDVVLGNPPYVRMELLTPLKPYLKENYKVVSERADLYTYFFELGFKLLKPNGMLGFISSATFFKTGSGEPLRNYLKLNATLKKVVDFGDLQVFEGVTTYPAILVFQKATPVDDSQIQILVLKNELPEKLSEFFAENHGIMAHSQLQNESWQFEDARLSQLRDKLTNGFSTLKDVYGSPLYGIKTGLNEAFVIDGTTKKRLISQDPNSAKFLKPFLEGKDLKKWHAQPRDLWIIYIPKNRIKIDDYPAIHDWLLPFKSNLEKRATKQEWFELQQAQEAYQSHFEQSKIQYAHFSSNPLFHFNLTNHYSNDKSYIVPTTEQFLLGLLNSKLFWFLLINLCPCVRGGFYELRSQYVETLPIPPATPEQKTKIGELAQRCQTLSEARYKLEKDTRLTFEEDLNIKKFTQKLEKWWALEFKAFSDELLKSNKIEIDNKKRTQFRDFFNAEKEQRAALDFQIRTLEKELNALVYRLFDLNAEEIGLIEKSNEKLVKPVIESIPSVDIEPTKPKVKKAKTI